MLGVWEGFNGGGAQVSGVNGAVPDLHRLIYIYGREIELNVILSDSSYHGVN